VIEACDHGLVDCATPIIIKGKHLASLATGQMLLQQPDLDRFRKQAKLFGFNEEEYLESLREIPVVSREKLKSITALLGEIATIISEMGYTQLMAKKEAEALEAEIIERRRVEHKLIEEREQLMVTLRSIGDGVITTDINGNITLMNKVAEKLTGWKFCDSFGKPLHQIFKIVTEDTHEGLPNPADMVFESGHTVKLPEATRLIRKDGRELLIADSGAPLRKHDGSIAGVVLVFRDVTMERKAESSIKNADKLESLGILAGGLAHDFNNYLGGILGHIELALNSIESGDSQQAAAELKSSLSVFGKAKDLTHQFLTFAKGGAPILGEGSITDLVQEIAQFSISGSNSTLSLKVEPNLPTCAFDSNQIARVIQNMIINAKQAMPDGGEITISLKSADITETHLPIKPGRYIIISIRDSGKGIPEKIMARIFDPFFSTKEHGSGLGLSICYSIIKKHNGTIDVSRVTSGGTQFDIYLPTLKPSISRKKKKAGHTEHSGSGNVLIMDDDTHIREFLSSVLESMGYTVSTAGNGKEVLDILKTNTFRFIVLDLTIPGGMGGAETAQEIRKLYGDRDTIIAMSGYADDCVISDPRRHSFNSSISKPFRINEIHDMLNRILQNSQ
jgi:PAS domain S-box-containing protein